VPLVKVRSALPCGYCTTKTRGCQPGMLVIIHRESAGSARLARSVPPTPYPLFLLLTVTAANRERNEHDCLPTVHCTCRRAKLSRALHLLPPVRRRRNARLDIQSSATTWSAAADSRYVGPGGSPYLPAKIAADEWMRRQPAHPHPVLPPSVDSPQPVHCICSRAARLTSFPLLSARGAEIS
jgi:hypothetical protein